MNPDGEEIKLESGSYGNSPRFTKATNGLRWMNGKHHDDVAPKHVSIPCRCAVASCPAAASDRYYLKT
jgi:hypothetical protein